MQTIIFKPVNTKSTNEVAELFTSAFTTSEGEDEGKLIGKLALELALNIDDQAIFCFGAYRLELLVGAIFLTRLHFEASHLVYMLAPVAVQTAYQGKGIGQSLINYGLEEMKKHSVTAVVTYGDPGYYCKVGFQPLSENVIQPPLALTMPEGWLGCSLTGKEIPAMHERPACVKAFNNPVYW